MHFPDPPPNILLPRDAYPTGTVVATSDQPPDGEKSSSWWYLHGKRFETPPEQFGDLNRLAAAFRACLPATLAKI